MNQGEQSKLTIDIIDPEYETIRPQNKISSKVTENDLCPALSEVPSELDSGPPTKREEIVHFRSESRDLVSCSSDEDIISKAMETCD